MNGFPLNFIRQTIYSGNLDVMFSFLIYWIFKKQDVEALTGLIWLGTGTAVVNVVMNFRFP